MDMKLEISTGSLFCLHRWLEPTVCLDPNSPNRSHISIIRVLPGIKHSMAIPTDKPEKSQFGEYLKKQFGLRTQGLDQKA